MARANWLYDEMRQVGMDFEDADQVVRYDSRQGTNRDREAGLVKRLGITDDTVVVDLGCGTGSFALEAARSGARVFAIDVSQTMLDFVRSAAAREALDNIQTGHAGFLTFDLSPRSVDVVVSRAALHHLPDFWKQAAFLRIHDALRPDGRFYLRDVAFSFDARNYESGIEHWVRRMPEQSGFTRQEFEMHVREDYSTYSWVLEGFLERAGFEILERTYPAEEYAEYLCRPVPLNA